MAPKSRRLKTARRHRRSTAGKILPPLDVRSNKQLKDFERIIKQGGLTFVLVWAPWCDHCHRFMPHFDAAAKSPNRSVQAIKVQETMLPAVNKILTTNVNKSAAPLNVEGYPSIIVVDNKGNKVTDIEAVKDTEVMKNAMENAGPLATNAGLTSAGLTNARQPTEVPQDINMGEDEVKGSIITTNIKNSRVPFVASKNKIASVPTTLKKLSQEASEVTSLVTPITPPNPNNDTESIMAKKIGGGGGCSNGGSLYSSLMRTAYTLAPTAALLASAAIVMKKTKKMRKTTRKSVKTRRHRR